MTPSDAAHLLDEIEKFIERTGMAETYFGVQAARNPHLVRRLRNGGRVWPETAANVRAFMQGTHHRAPADNQGRPK